MHFQESVRAFSLGLPSAVEEIKWEDNLVFSVGKKMFAILSLNPPFRFSFKCTPDDCAELVERPGIIPAPYLARYHWVCLTEPTALDWTECRRLIRNSYRLVRAKLPKRILADLDGRAAQ